MQTNSSLQKCMIIYTANVQTIQMPVFSLVPSNGSYAIPFFSLRQHVLYFYRNVHSLFIDTFFIHWSEFASNYHVYLLESWVTLVLAGILSIYLVFSKSLCDLPTEEK